MKPGQPALNHLGHTPQPGDSRDGAIGFAFHLYRSLISPVLHGLSPSRCLYLPTCSEYAYTAISRFGVVRGSLMALQRFARCHPWGKGGLDPVPERCCSSARGAGRPACSGSGQKGADHLP